MGTFWQDLRYAFRVLRNSPWFAALAVVTLSLGIAVNTSIFSVVNGFILRPMPVPDPEQLAVLSLQQAGDHSLQKFSYPDYVDLRDQSASFSDIIAYKITLAGLAADNRGDHCIVTRVSSNYFSVLGVQPALGRLILPTEGQTPGSDPIVILGFSYWQKRFAGDQTVLGKHVEINHHPATIVGVAPKEFHGTYSIVDSDLYVPLSANLSAKDDSLVQDTWTRRSDRSLSLVVRLKPGITLKQAQASLNVVANRIAEQHPDTDKGISILGFPEKLARPDPDPDNTLPAVAAALWASPLSFFSWPASMSPMFCWFALPRGSVKWPSVPLSAPAALASSASTSRKVFSWHSSARAVACSSPFGPRAISARCLSARTCPSVQLHA